MKFPDNWIYIWFIIKGWMIWFILCYGCIIYIFYCGSRNSKPRLSILGRFYSKSASFHCWHSKLCYFRSKAVRVSFCLFMQLSCFILTLIIACMVIIQEFPSTIAESIMQFLINFFKSIFNQFNCYTESPSTNNTQ